MNAISYALQQLKFDIPQEVLKIGFTPERISSAVSSIDSVIEATVIRPMVLTDCDLIGGITMYIDTAVCGIEMVDDNRYIIDVPKAITNFKSIISAYTLVANSTYATALSIGQYTNTQTPGYASSSTALDVGTKAMDNLSSFNIVQTSSLELIGENLILVQDPMMSLNSCVLKCSIANSINMENLKARSYPKFSELVTLGVKRYLYNRLKINLDKGFLYGGQDLTSITDIIESYSDAKEMYMEQRKIMAKILFMNDSLAYGKFINALIPNNC